MSIQQIKADLYEKIGKVEDERLLKLFTTMIEVYTEGHQEEKDLEELLEDLPVNPAWKPQTEEELMSRLEESSAQIARGEYITLEALKEKMKSW